MRNYLYIWHDANERFLCASGIQFEDMCPILKSSGGIVLLKHEAHDHALDVDSGLEFLPASTIPSLLEQDIYSWGTFSWADYASRDFPRLDKQEVAELLYFAHRAMPFASVALRNLGNRFLAYGHDDGWYFKCFYSDWAHARAILDGLVLLKPHRDVTELLQSGTGAFWISDGAVVPEERTFDIDSVLNRRLSRHGQS